MINEQEDKHPSCSNNIITNLNKILGLEKMKTTF